MRALIGRFERSSTSGFWGLRPQKAQAALTPDELDAVMTYLGDRGVTLAPTISQRGLLDTLRALLQPAPSPKLNPGEGRVREILAQEEPLSDLQLQVLAEYVSRVGRTRVDGLSSEQLHARARGLLTKG